MALVSRFGSSRLSLFCSSMFLSSISVLALLVNWVQSAAHAQPVELKQELVAAKLKQYPKACFELLDCSTGKVFKYNEEQCKTRIAPMSTFKLFNSLAGLETGVLKDENHFMKWDGEKRYIDSWNQDQTLASAMKNSVVWYYQKVAEGVGEKRMKDFLSKSHYGNEDISGGITEFWLDKGLKISPDEQVEFIKNLYFDKLPFSKRSMDIVKKITELKKTEIGELHGKTGTNRENGVNNMGWFVGYIVHNGRPYVFACNVQADGASGPNVRKTTEEILSDSGLL